MTSTISIIYSYYNNPITLASVLETLASWNTSILRNVEVVIVDDGSREFPAIDVIKGKSHQISKLRIRVFRILEDKPWNHRVARNLGAWRASGEWLLMLDMDMIPSKKLISQVLHTANPDDFYMFSLKKAYQKTSLEAHHDAILMTSRLFWRIGGYDESFKGLWGTGPLFLRRAKRVANRIKFMHLHIVDLSEESHLDSQTKLPRKLPIAKRVKVWVIRLAKFTRVAKVRVLTESYVEEHCDWV